jgi:hypothetical protein
MYNAERWSKSADYEKGDLINNSRARMVASIAVLAAAAGYLNSISQGMEFR